MFYIAIVASICYYLITRFTHVQSITSAIFLTAVLVIIFFTPKS